MRLNDPQIELVHDDPFMGYINEDTTVEETSDRAEVTVAPASPLAIVDEVSSSGEDPDPVAQPHPVDTVPSDEELDVGENSRTEAIASIEKSLTTAPVASVQRSVEPSPTTATTAAQHRQPFVIVLLME
uniref:Uncharacterized protein n=1 Tax=Anopheles stephensi TaxID=30069 RepID=A0A182XUY8_ANOST